MRHLRIATGLVALYGLILVANAVFYWSWSGDTSEVPRLLIRLFGCGLVGYGLWIGAKWGWWLGVIFSGVLMILGTLSVLAGVAAGIFDARPYPTVDVAISIGLTAALLSAFSLIVSPSARQAARGRSNAVGP